MKRKIRSTTKAIRHMPARLPCPNCGKKSLSSVDLEASMLDWIFTAAHRCRSCGWIDGIRRDE